jgi:hypothetical protein
VLSLRFGLVDGYSRTLEEVGKQFKVTRERIRQIEAKALRKMRHPTRIRQLHGFFDVREECALILQSHLPAVIMIDDFEVPGDPGYGFDDYGAGRQLALPYLAPLGAPELTAFFPAVPSGQETGARRGCVILATTPAIAQHLRGIATLRPLPTPASGATGLATV